MGTTADKLAYLEGTKAAIREAISARGVELSESAPFREYAERIGEIGGSGSSMPSVISPSRAKLVMKPLSSNIAFISPPQFTPNTRSIWPELLLPLNAR